MTIKKRVWGDYEVFIRGDRFKVKKLRLNLNEGVSLQKHLHRSEHWIVVSGSAKVTRGEDSFLLGVDEHVFIPKNVVHKLENNGKILLEVIEVQNGEYLEEDDIERFEEK